MFPKITIGLIFQLDQRFSEHRPAENVDAHGSQVAARLLRLLFELFDPAFAVCHNDSESARFLDRHRHRGDRDIRFVCLVKIEHDLVIHLINMIPRKNQHIIRIICLHVVQVLVNCICRPCVPLAVRALLVGRQNRYPSNISVQIPRDTDPDMRIKTQRLILRQHAHSVDSRINTVTQREINDPVLASECHGRLCNLCCEDPQSTALSARQQHGNHFLFKHCVTSFLVRCNHYTIYLSLANNNLQFFLIFFNLFITFA